MTAPRYRFVDVLEVRASADDVYAVLSCPRDYPEWWGNVFLEADGDHGPALPGKRASVVTRGLLPYRLRWALECVEAEAPTRLVSRLTGDFEGSGTWTIEPTSDGTRARLEWDVTVNKKLVRRLTPILRPLFRWNHHLAVGRGRDALARRLA